MLVPGMDALPPQTVSAILKGIASSSPALARQRLRWGQRKMHINSERVESSRTSGTNPEHHRDVAFRDQLGELRRRHEIEFDERYVWD